jgi:hypothetical protein
MTQIFHPGSWSIGGYKLPDLGITEAIGQNLGVPAPRNDSGGSNWLPDIGGQVLGTQIYAPTSTTSSGPAIYPQRPIGPMAPSGYQVPTQSSPTDSGMGGENYTGPSAEDLFNQAWSGYTDSLNQQLQGLEGQRTSQLGTAQSTLDTGTKNLGLQYDTNKGQIEGQQTKTLNDLTSALQNYWSQGNAMLGTRGASDSSAANMYSYALAKLGSKQRGDVMSDYSSRLQNLKSVYDQNMNSLQNDYNTQVNQIGQWFAEAQNAVRGLQGQAAQQKGQQILDYGMQLLSQQQQAYQQKQGLLDQWAANHATSLQQLMGQMNQNAQNMPGYTNIFGNLQGGQTSSPGLFGFGNTSEKPLFPTG